MTVARSVVVEADGGARGNPGPGGYGAVVRAVDGGDPGGERGAVIAERSAALGVTTNNVAEYTGLIEGLRAAAEAGADDVLVRMDSRIVIEQMTGRWQIRNPGLRPLAARAAELVAGFAKVRFEWVPRERNMDADALANAAIEAAARAPSGVGWAPRTDPPMRLILVRHGATEFTAAGRYSGRGDVALTALGRDQAAAVAARIVAMPSAVAAVLTSPLARCTETAETICAALPVHGGHPARLAPLVEPDLIECDFGKWEGLTFAEVRERYPVEFGRWAASAVVAPPGGESFRTVTSRVRRFVTSLRGRYPDQVVVAVTHVTPIKIMLKDALLGGDQFVHRMHLDAAGISIIDSWPDGGVSVRAVNETAHLVPR